MTALLVTALQNKSDMTIPGIDMVIAVGLMAAIGQVEPFVAIPFYVVISRVTFGPARAARAMFALRTLQPLGQTTPRRWVRLLEPSPGPKFKAAFATAHGALGRVGGGSAEGIRHRLPAQDDPGRAGKGRKNGHAMLSIPPASSCCSKSGRPYDPHWLPYLPGDRRHLDLADSVTSSLVPGCLVFQGDLIEPR
jgi:hypothetical protein